MKKSFGILLSVFFLVAFFFNFSISAPKPITFNKTTVPNLECPVPPPHSIICDLAPLGNPDGEVNVGDALLCLRFALGLEPGHPTADECTHGDVGPLDSNGCLNPDGQVDLADSLVILRLTLGLIDFSHCTATPATLTIELTGVSPGTTFVGLDLTIDYNESKLTFISAAAGTLTSGATVIPNNDSNRVRVGLIKTDGFDGGSNGSVMVLTFDIIQPNISQGDFVVTDFSATDLIGTDAGLSTDNIYLGISSNMIPACEQGDYITIDDLYDCCGIPGACNQKMECEGKSALIKGYISYVNVWNKKEYPWLPYSKFLIYNAERNMNLEVRVDSDDADMIFKTIQAHSAHPDNPACIKGQLVGVDLPDMETCHRNLIIVLSEPESIFFIEEERKLDEAQ